jgi:uncharacterized protein
MTLSTLLDDQEQQNHSCQYSRVILPPARPGIGAKEEPLPGQLVSELFHGTLIATRRVEVSLFLSWFWLRSASARSAFVEGLRKGRAQEGKEVMAKELREGHAITTVVEAGRKGGRTVKEKYGPVFYAQIGKKGGQTIALERGSEYYSEIGKKGGEAVRERHGSLFFSEIGKKGGEAVKVKHGSDYYSRIGKKGGEAPRRADRRHPTGL